MKSGWRWGRIGVVVLAVATSCSPSQPPEVPRELVWAVHKLDVETAEPVAELWNRAHPGGPAVPIEAIPASADDQRQLLAIELDAGLPRFDIVTLVAEWKGKLWAAPFVTGAGLLYYRTDLVNEAPNTWAQLRDAVAEARRKGGERLIGLVGQGAQYEGLVVNFLEYFWGAGGDASSRELSEQPQRRRSCSCGKRWPVACTGRTSTGCGRTTPWARSRRVVPCSCGTGRTPSTP